MFNKSLTLTSKQLEMARDWLAECFWEDILCREDFDEISDHEIESGVRRHFDGGLEAFIKTCEG